jgi:hypothetical protein
VLSLLLALLACSKSHSISHQELQSKFRAAISLSAETADFLNHLDGHTYSHQFIQAHLSYLQKEGSDVESDLPGASVAAPDAPSLDALKHATAELTQLLDTLPTAAAPVQTSSIGHLNSIRQRLEADMPR